MVSIFVPKNGYGKNLIYPELTVFLTLNSNEDLIKRSFRLFEPPLDTFGTLPKPSCLLSRPFWTFGEPQRAHFLRVLLS